MSLARVGKQFLATNANQFVTVLTQLMLAPVFLHSYGVAMYGQWLALTAAISYLSTFNYGLQTYTNMEMTIRYSRGEVQGCREVQSAGLRILLGACVLFLTLLLSVFLIPLNRLLHLTISASQAHWTLYFLGCQIIGGMLFGFFSGNYMVIGKAHRGTHANNLNQLFGTGMIALLALFRLPFAVLASAQLAVTLLISVLLFFDFRRLAPDIRLTLRYWQPGMLGAILKPSGQYGLLYMANILAYQVPVLLMQRLLGPASVVMYTVTRTVYSMSRRLLNVVTNSVGPEITITYGQQAWKRLHRMYELSERIVLMLIVPITFGSMVATPLLLRLWLHKPNLYNPTLCLALGITASILGLKEHKYQFQFSTNNIREISYSTVVVYSLMVLASIPSMMRFGLAGFVTLWGAAETVQLFYLLHLNGRLFGRQATVDRKPVYQMYAILAVGSVLIARFLPTLPDLSTLRQVLLSLAVTIITGGASYWMFGVDEVRGVLWKKVSTRIPALARR